MDAYNFLVLGFFILVTGSSMAFKTSADLTDAEVELFKKPFREIIGHMTCDNYQELCASEKTKAGKICREYAQKYTCENMTDLEGTRKIIQVFEKYDPSFTERTLKDLKKQLQKKKLREMLKKLSEMD